jgi:hypothetical protein
MSDSSEAIAGNASRRIEGLYRFAGKRVMVTAGDALFDEEGYLVDDAGVLELPEVYGDLTVGLPYEMALALPDLHASLSGAGSTLGHKRAVDRAALRVNSSFGGTVQTAEGAPARDIFTLKGAGRNMLEGELGVKLFTGVVQVALSQDTNYHGRLTVRHRAALPFEVSAIGREVKFT